MKRESIPPNVIRRLPRYLRTLEELLDGNVECVSSSQLGRRLNLTPSQIRQDFSCFGEFGQQGYGYNVVLLRDAVASILGIGSGYSAVLFGAGNLGHALLKNFGFAHYGCRVLAAFDVDPALVGSSLGEIPVYSVHEFAGFAAENRVDIAVLAVPREFALSTARYIADVGVGAIWNFTNAELRDINESLLVEDVHFSDSFLALSYYLSERQKQENG